MSLLPLIEAVDSFPYEKNDFYWLFLAHTGDLLGYIVPEIALRLQAGDHAPNFHVDAEKKTVALLAQLSTFDKRNELFAAIANLWKHTDPLLAHGWRNELYTVYCPTAEPYMLLERAFACLLGVVTYGVHINGYVPADKSSDGVLKMWVPRRSPTKQTYPGKLDNTIAGGLAHPFGLWENVVKECYEEGGLPKEFVEKNARAAGVVAYLCQPYGPLGHAQPEVEYIYDLRFESETDHAPHPIDGEAESFELMPIDAVRQKMAAGEFKPNCALVIADFLVRHGYVTPENEPNYLQIVARTHRRLPFSTRN